MATYTVPQVVPSPAEDAAALLKAFQVSTYEDHGYHFDMVLRNATFESGTDEDSLTRVVVMHAEKDMKGISSAFRRRSSVTLEQAIAKETSGDYRSFLMALLGS
uniref:Annexin n=1 Tax=Setaria italica TaxID=4555 RepID=K3ZKG7_SETIT